eukprot:scaffold3854_cov251-Pinguiococcus_pyrenoidosus.AAC.16
MARPGVNPCSTGSCDRTTMPAISSVIVPPARLVSVPSLWEGRVVNSAPLPASAPLLASAPLPACPNRPQFFLSVLKPTSRSPLRSEQLLLRSPSACSLVRGPLAPYIGDRQEIVEEDEGSRRPRSRDQTDRSMKADRKLDNCSVCAPNAVSKRGEPPVSARRSRSAVSAFDVRRGGRPRSSASCVSRPLKLTSATSDASQAPRLFRLRAALRPALRHRADPEERVSTLVASRESGETPTPFVWPRM